MQSLEISSSDGAAKTLGDTGAPVTAGWLLRRMALWLLFVVLGVAGACLLYVAASKAEAESVARSASSPPLARTVKG